MRGFFRTVKMSLVKVVAILIGIVQGLRAKDLDTIGIAINKNTWSLYLRVMIDLIDNR